jgi:hypothetical protein
MKREGVNGLAAQLRHVTNDRPVSPVRQKEIARVARNRQSANCVSDLQVQQMIA